MTRHFSDKHPTRQYNLFNVNQPYWLGSLGASVFHSVYSALSANGGLNPARDNYTRNYELIHYMVPIVDGVQYQSLRSRNIVWVMRHRPQQSEVDRNSA